MTIASQFYVRGLYAITPDLADTEALCTSVDAALRGGASLVQYRNKTASPALRMEQAQALLSLCRQYGTPLIINDDVDLFFHIDAHGLHLGADDIEANGGIAQIRARLAAKKILGVSCYNNLDLAHQAKQQGADYVAFGACFKSATKPAALTASMQLISQARNDLDLPIVAIGGITLDNAPLVISAGADSIAVINALFKADNIQQTAQQFTQLFDKNHDKSAHIAKPATL